MRSFIINAIGHVVKNDGKQAKIKLNDSLKDGLKGLREFSHVIVIYWLHLMDKDPFRNRLLVHPRGNPANPLVGVFSTRSPARPNPIGIKTVEIIEINEEKGFVIVKELDAFEGTPIIDLKPYLPGDAIKNIHVAGWFKRRYSNNKSNK